MPIDSPPRAPVLTLIDASGFIFRAYHAIQHLSTSKGVPTNAVYGFTRMLLKTIREFSPTHLALAFDKQSRLGRQAIDPNYKANREGPPPDLIPQFELIRRVVAALNVPILEFEGWEADDVIGTLAKKAKEKGFKVFVVTGDKDFIQIVDEEVELYDPMQEKKTTTRDVQERLGIRPSQMRDYLALIGDPIDNVPKVPGIGPKTAAELIQQFDSVEAIIARAAEIQKPKVREAIREYSKQLELAKQIVSFRTDLPLDVDIDALARRPMHEAAARSLFSELEFYKLLQEMPTPAPTPLSAETRLVTSLDELTQVVKIATEEGAVAIAAAFDGPPYAARWVGIALSLSDGTTYYVPTGHTLLSAHSQPSARAVIEILGPMLENETVRKIGHNLKALTSVMASLGVQLRGVDSDVELLSYLLNPSRREHALVDLTRERLRCELPSVPGGAKNKIEPSELTIEEAAAIYGACADASRRLAQDLWEELDRAGLSKLARTIEIPLLPILAKMERRGIRVDPEALARINRKAEADCEIQLKTIYQLVGHEFNVNSNGQLAEVLYNELKLPILKRGKTGPSTDQEVLEKLGQQHPLPSAILEYRTISKLKSTYLDPLPHLVAKDGRLHTTLHQVAAATGRLSSSDPNLQNIPIRTELGREVRRAFVAESGASLISADYSQIELRILAHVAEDAALIEAFLQDADIHTRTAAEIFDISPEQVTPNQRRAAKAVNFGIAYGLSPHGLSTRLDISTEEAKSIIDRYFERYVGIRAYLELTIEHARKTGYVETLFGRRRYMGDIHSRNRNAAQAAERAAINMPIQGTAADLIKLAMIRLDDRLTHEQLSAQMLLQVHDELLIEAPDSEVAAVTEIAREAMSQVATLRVPLKVDIGVGHSWAEAH